jgi:acyl-CoA thioester hydrolase
MAHARIEVRVPFVDVDSSARIHFTAMMRYMERAEHELMRAIGFPYATTLQGMGFPRVHISCDYIKAIRFDDRLIVEARTEKVGRSSWTIAFNAFLVPSSHQDAPPEESPAATGRMTIVATNPQTERAQPLPDALRAALLAD